MERRSPKQQLIHRHWLLVPLRFRPQRLYRIRQHHLWVPEAQEPSASRQELECKLDGYQTSCSSVFSFWNTALPNVFGDFNCCIWTYLTAGMYVQIRVTETEMPKPRNSEAKLLSLRAVFTITMLGWGRQHPCLRPVTLGRHRRVGGANHSSVLSKDRTLVNMRPSWISSVHNSSVYLTFGDFKRPN